jgi:hypothetical protein
MEHTVSPMWRFMMGLDNAVVSLKAYGKLRKAKKSKHHEPPRDWVNDYKKLVNAEVSNEGGVRPFEGEDHPCVKRGGTGTVAERRQPLTDSQIMYCDLPAILKWHVLRAVMSGEDLSDFAFEGGSKALTFKLAFDTTVTGGQDMFMLGVIPHEFCRSSKVQSANNVLVVSLARIAEDKNVIENAHPRISAIVKELQDGGLFVDLGDGQPPLHLKVDMHVAADLKALWLALGLDAFACPFCLAKEWDEMNNIALNMPQRELGEALGVPADRVHLCALHATLRIVERLLKNCAEAAFTNDSKDKKHRIPKLRRHLCKVLFRKKFVITAKVKEYVGEPDLMEVDDLYDVGNAAFGRNVQAAVSTTRTLLKLSSLTGPQAAKILTDKLYVQVIAICEGDCYCDELRAARGDLPAAQRRHAATKCRVCMVTSVWETYAEKLYPWVSKNAAHQECLGDQRAGFLANIKATALAWLQEYVAAFGRRITPYVHIVGKHLADMLAGDSASVGLWSQQGFEACHKLIRYIIQHATSLGGGRDRVSPLRQVLAHLYRRSWAGLRELLSDKSIQKLVQGTLDGRRVTEWVEERVGSVDTAFDTLYPLRDLQAYAGRQASTVLNRPRVRSKACKAAVAALCE